MTPPTPLPPARHSNRPHRETSSQPARQRKRKKTGRPDEEIPAVPSPVYNEVRPFHRPAMPRSPPQSPAGTGCGRRGRRRCRRHCNRRLGQRQGGSMSACHAAPEPAGSRSIPVRLHGPKDVALSGGAAAVHNGSLPTPPSIMWDHSLAPACLVQESWQVV